MIRQDIRIGRIGWSIRIYYAVTHYEVDEIMESLEGAGCHGEDLERAYRNLSSGKMNTGICHTGDHCSVLVISVTSSADQFMDSLVHELHHLATQIATRTKMSLTGEGVCYLAGRIAKEMHPVARRFLCERCRHKLQAGLNPEHSP